MSREFIKKNISDGKVIAIIRGVPEAKIMDTVAALVEGGITLLEFTFDHGRSDYISETISKIKKVKEHFKNQICIGAGTVLSVEEVDAAIDAGAEFIISPNVDEAVIKRTAYLNKVSIPGALTPTEAVLASRYGADYVKLFPAGELGLNYVKAVMSPLSHIPFIAVGGIHPNNIKEFIDLGVHGVGIGGNLILKDAIRTGNFKQISEKSIEFIKNINRTKETLK